MNTDTAATMRWIDRACGHIAELERDPRQFEYMMMAAEIWRAVLAAELTILRTEYGGAFNA